MAFMVSLSCFESCRFASLCINQKKNVLLCIILFVNVSLLLYEFEERDAQQPEVWSEE